VNITEAIGRTPLVAMEAFAPNLLGKCEHMNPGGSVKDRLALALIEAGERSGQLKTGATLVEATAGNTGIGLALVAARRGYRLVCCMPAKMSVDKRLTLKALGAELVICANCSLDHPENFQNTARRLALENGWFHTDQFCHPANAEVHFRTTGPELWEQTRGNIGAFVAGVGTGGTITGVARFLKAQNPDVRIVLADPAGSPLADWVSTGRYGADLPYKVEGIGTGRAPQVFDPALVDGVESVDDEESFATARRCWREEGLLVGGSSGTAVAAALRVAQRGFVGELPVLGPVVALLADSWDRYLSTAWMQEV
jgi:cysteine synthase